MENEIVKQADSLPVQVEMTPIQIYQQAVSSGLNVEYLKSIQDLIERTEDRQASKDYAAALAKFQTACPAIPKEGEVHDNRGNLMYKYAKLDKLMDIIQPHLTDAGLTIKFSTEITDQHVKADCTVRCGVHAEVSSATVPVPTDMSKINKAQQGGVAIAYAKKYALMAGLNLVATDEDTDAATIIETITEDQAIGLQDIASQLDGITHQKCLALLKINTWNDLPKIKHAKLKARLVKMVEDKNKKGGGK